MALLEAQSAVQMDNEANIAGALESYSKAVQLLGKVIEATHVAEERERLKIIHDSYRFRMHLLSTPPVNPVTQNGEGSASNDGIKTETSASGTSTNSETIASGTQDLPPVLQQAQQSSVPLQTSFPPLTPMTPPPIPPRSPPNRHTPPPQHPRSPPPQHPRSPPPQSPPSSSRPILSPSIGPQLQRKPSLTKKTFNSYSTAQAQAQAVQQFVSATISSAEIDVPTTATAETDLKTIEESPSLVSDTTADSQAKAKTIVSHGPLASPPPPPPPQNDISTSTTSTTRRPRADTGPISSTSALSTVTEGVADLGLGPRVRQRSRIRSAGATGVATRNVSHDLASVPENVAIHHPRRIRDRDQLPKAVDMETAPKAPLPPPPPARQASEVTSEPMFRSESPVLGHGPGVIVSAPASVLSPLSPLSPLSHLSPSGMDLDDSILDPKWAAAPRPAPAPPSVSPLRSMSPPPRPMSPPPPRPMSPPPPLRTMSPPPPMSPQMRPNRSGAISPTPKLKRSGAPSLTSAHIGTFSALSDTRPLSPPPISPLPEIPPNFTSPPTSPMAPPRATKPMFRSIDIHGVAMTSIDLSLSSQTQDVVEDQGAVEINIKESEQVSESNPVNHQRHSSQGLKPVARNGKEEEQTSESSSSNRFSQSSASSLEKDQEIKETKVAIKRISAREAMLREWLPDLMNESFGPTDIVLEGPTPFTPPMSPIGTSTSPAQKRSSFSALNNGSLRSVSSGASHDSQEKRHVLMGSNESQQSFSSSSSTTSSVQRQQVSAPVGTEKNKSKRLSLELPTSPSMKPSRTGKLSKLIHPGQHRELTLQEVISQDPFSGMKAPIPPKELDPPPPADPYLRCFWFMHLLEQTMTTGGFLSSKLYVPRDVWYQKTSVRLPSIEAKITACQSVSQTLDNMVAQSKAGKLTLLVEVGGNVEKGERDRNELLKELENLETLTLDIWGKLSKKMAFLQKPNQGDASGYPNMMKVGYHSQNVYYQGNRLANDYNSPFHDESSSSSDPYSWLGADDPISASLGSSALSTGTLSSGTLTNGGLNSSVPTNASTDKGASHKRATSDLMNHWKVFSKSVQKTIVTDKIEDTTSYTEALIQVFRSSFILESMIKHFEALPPHQTHIKIISRIQRICDFYNMVVCAFVVRDLGDLMVKYVKRMGAMVTE
ncbi:hypothetical protein BGZ46_009837 [Entomortierella lignicola]|nr:hypothetical protein BGZ46_009837 [Entomortierella lignicola]